MQRDDRREPRFEPFGVGAGTVHDQLTFGALHPISSNLVVAGSGDCSVPVVASDVPESVLAKFEENPVTGTVQLPGQPFSHTDSDSGSEPNHFEHGEGTTTVSWENTVKAFTGGGPFSSVPTGGPSPAQEQAKKDAVAALRYQIAAAIYPCTVATVGAGVFAGGYVTAISGAGIPAALMGAILSGVAGPICLVHIQTIKALAKIADDPPVPDPGRLARVAPVRFARVRLPACPPHGSARCATVERELRALLAAASASAATARAAQTTMGRLTSDRSRHRRRAASAQTGHLRRLTARLTRELRREKTISRGLRRALAAAGLSLAVPPAEATPANAALAAALRRGGIEEAELQKLVPGALPAAPAAWPAG